MILFEQSDENLQSYDEKESFKKFNGLQRNRIAVIENESFLMIFIDKIIKLISDIDESFFYCIQMFSTSFDHTDIINVIDKLK